MSGSMGGTSPPLLQGVWVQTQKVDTHHLNSEKCKNMAALCRRQQVAEEVVAVGGQRFQAYQ